MSSRVFIGRDMGHDPEYLRCITQYTLEVFNASARLHTYHPFLRPIVARFLPETKAIRKSCAAMIKIMTPVIASRADLITAGSPQQDLTTWNLLNSPPADRSSIKIQSHLQLFGSMAAIHTTSLTSSHAIYDLASHPEYTASLRAEIDAVMKNESTPYLTKTSMPKLKLLDSFCKESQRTNPLIAASFSRKILKDITLHDGTILPAGTHIAVPAREISRDPDIYPDPDVFDGYRYLKLREKPGMENRHQFVSTGIDNLNFGYGTHACPGRFFANNELKVILTYLLQHYDLKMPDGEGRPGNVYTPGGLQPDTTKTLLMRKRQA
ncbi:MAG: hypothetical protein Q9160_001582 [Pyrenula sp. 1 TL-2023]